ncbi:hypothetical protein T10_5110 [Trichinella papuae]|uniref:Uncharacterized protein n=1 Tax=Trichinella papuae TaxID=268474 RepID=A0A0V1M6M5_9BILA|nr:hypothetical protein T10_5110 [Trichinella papuae]
MIVSKRMNFQADVRYKYITIVRCRLVNMQISKHGLDHFNGNRPQIDFIRTCDLRVDLSYVRPLRRIVDMTRMEFLCMSNDRSDEKE